MESKFEDLLSSVEEESQFRFPAENTLLLGASKMVERSGYYGLRAILILYMVGQTFGMEDQRAFMIYGFFTSAIAFSPILGGLIGDLLTGNKNSSIAGAFIQAAGAFCLALIPTKEGLNLGLGLVIIGSGLYNPNLIAIYAKQYLHKPRLLDTGFTVFYLLINIGALIGTIAIPAFQSASGFSAAFILAGVFLLVSAVLPIFYQVAATPPPRQSTAPVNLRILHTVLALILGGLFWGIFELRGSGVFNIQQNFTSNNALNLSSSTLTLLNPAFVIPAAVIAAIAWYFIRIPSFVKVALALIMSAIGYGLLLQVSAQPMAGDIYFFVLSALFLAIAEILFAPIALSIIAQYTKPKYLAIIFSVSIAIFQIGSFLVGLVNRYFNFDSITIFSFSAIVMALIGLGVGVYALLTNGKTSLKV